MVLASAAATAEMALVAPAATIAMADGRGCLQGVGRLGGRNSRVCPPTYRGGGGGGGAAGGAGACRGDSRRSTTSRALALRRLWLRRLWRTTPSWRRRGRLWSLLP